MEIRPQNSQTLPHLLPEYSFIYIIMLINICST